MNTPVRGIVFCTGSASSLRYLLEHDPAFGTHYKIVGVFADNPEASGLTFATEHGIPTKVLDFKRWRQENNVQATDLKGREAYFAQVLELVHEWEFDFILLSGYMSIITDPVLSQFWGKILNVHPAWLSLMNDDRSRRYTGLNVVARAMDAGDPTGSTVHLLTAEPDMGPIVAESPALPYAPWDEPKDHQEKMKTACDGPAYQEALRRLIDVGWPQTPWRG